MLRHTSSRNRKSKRWLIVVIVFLSLFARLPIQIQAQDEPKPVFTMSPTKILSGRTRDVTITVDKGDLSQYAPQRPPESTGITYELVGDKLFRLANENKSMIIRMKVDSDADVGIVKILVAKSDGSDVHAFDLEISKKLEAGPTPDDMKEVDAMWGVLPYKVTKVNFGRRVADSFYAVEVRIGNNSGFDLQIVGVGFDSTMGRQPILDGQGNPILDEHGNKLVPALDNNGDPITVNGKLVHKPFKTYQLPTSDHRLVRGSIEFEQLYGRRALVLNLIGGMGTFISGFIPFFHALNARANFSTFSSIVNGQLKEGFAIAAPDLTVSQLGRLEDMVLRDGLTVLNNSQVSTTVFFPRYVVPITKDEKKLVDEGTMYPVIDKLGELIIVGKPLITFKNREIVAARPGGPPPPSPAPTRSPIPEPTGGSPSIVAGTDTINIPGTNLLNVSEVSIGGLNGTIRSQTSTLLAVKVPPNPISGDVIITSRGGAPTSVGKLVFAPRFKKPVPESGAAKSDVLIEGANLADVEEVLVGEDEATIKSQEAGRLVFQVPENAHSGDLVLKWPGGGDVRSPGKFIAQPVITQLAPAKAGQGIKVTLTGYNLENVSKVEFGEAEANFEFAKKADDTDDPTRLIVTVPEAAVSGPIRVTTKPDLAGASKAFTFVPMPAVPDFPKTVVAGQDIDIVGTNLAEVKKIKIGDVEIPKSAIKENTPTKISLTVPAGTASGKITITTEGGTISSTDALTITVP